MSHLSWYKSLAISLLLIVMTPKHLLFGASIKNTPTIGQGILDCRKWDFSSDAPLSLKGEWEMYWNALYAPKDFTSAIDAPQAKIVEFPALWRNTKFDNTFLPNQGYATYRIRILTDCPKEPLAFEIPDVYSAYRLWVNDEIIAQNGMVGQSKSSSYPHWLPKIKEVDLSLPVNEVILQVSNFHHSKGGAKECIVLGKKANLQTKHTLELSSTLMLTGALIMGCLFFLGLYLFGRREKAGLYFSLFCIVFCYRIIGTDTYVLHEYFPDLDWAITTRLEYIALFLSVSFFLEFIDKVFVGEFSAPLIRTVHTINGLLTGATLLLPAIYYTHIADFYIVILFALIFYGAFVLIRAWMHKKEGADFAVLSFVILFFTFGITMLDYLNISSVGLFLPFFGYMLFFFFQSLILSRKFAVSYQKAVAAAEEGSRIKSDFLATMSHEIRTPMNGMIGMTSLLAQTELTDQQRKFTDTIRLSGENLMTIINDILDFSKIESQNMELECQVFELKNAITEIVELFSLQASKKGLSIQYTIAEGVPEYIVGDVTRLKQVIINLVNNAIKFTDEGEINIRVKRAVASLANESILLRFEVEDTGIGIEASKTDRLFAPFSQVDSSIARKYGGTGLGLAICQKLVHLMGGQIGVQSEEGQGTVFTFTAEFAKASQEEIQSIQPKPEVVQVTTEKLSAQIPLRILVVEDNAINLQLVLFILKKEGYIADTAGNGQEAVDAVERQTYDIIFMDMQMPVMDGLEASRRIMAKYPEDKRPIIVALTANVMKEDKEKCFAAGMVDFIAKPLKLGIVKECLVKWGGKIHAESHHIVVSN